MWEFHCKLISKLIILHINQTRPFAFCFHMVKPMVQSLLLTYGIFLKDHTYFKYVNTDGIYAVWGYKTHIRKPWINLMKNANLSNYSLGQSSIAKQLSRILERGRTNSWGGNARFPGALAFLSQALRRLQNWSVAQVDRNQPEFPGTLRPLLTSLLPRQQRSEEALFFFLSVCKSLGMRRGPSC